MEKQIEILFPGNKRVDARLGAFTVQTDQLKRNGGDETAVQPFDLFFISLATCAGISALEYCRENRLPEEGLAVRLVASRHPRESRYDKVRIEVTPPEGLAKDQIERLLEAAGNCSVKRHIVHPPQFDVVLMTRER